MVEILVIQELQKELKRSKEEVRRSKEDCVNQIQTLEERLKNSPDPLEFSRLQARVEELQEHNETLKKELENASQREQDLKDMHNNYMMQVQTLINQKAIKVSGDDDKPWWKFW